MTLLAPEPTAVRTPLRPAGGTVRLSGAGDLASWLAGEPVLVLVDAALADGQVHEQLADTLDAARTRSTWAPVSHRTTLETLTTLAETIARTDAVVVGVGGGGVMDQAKLATALADEASVVRRLTARQRCALVALPATVRRRHRLLLVPTTVGTGAQHSPNACVQVGADKRLVNGAALRPDAVIEDGRLLTGLPSRLVAEGALEMLARLAGFYTGDDAEVPEADRATRTLLAEVVAAGFRATAPGPRPTAAVLDELTRLCARTHGADLVAGRAMFLDRSWPLSHQLSADLGVRKMQAMAGLLPPLWRRVTDTGTPWGSPRRLQELWDVVRTAAPVPLTADPATGVAELISHWGVRPGLHEAARAYAATCLSSPATLAGCTARRACAAWGDGLPMLRGLAAPELIELYHDALEERPELPATVRSPGSGATPRKEVHTCSTTTTRPPSSSPSRRWRPRTPPAGAPRSAR